MKLFVFSIFLILVAVVVNSGNELSKPNRAPESYVYNGNYGATYKRPAVTTEQRSITHWAQDIAINYVLPRIADAPASLVATTLSESCGLPQPSTNAKIASVQIYEGNSKAPLHFVSPKKVQALREYLETKKSRPYLEPKIAGNVDVFVSEVNQPTYLVLSSYSSVIWSIHLAKGARLDGVSIVGYHAQALAHVPENIPVGFVVFSGSPQRDCMVVPQAPVTDSWLAIQRAQHLSTGSSFRYTIEDANEKHLAYRDWLRDSVGAPEIEVVALATANVLIGPPPSTPIQHRSLAGINLVFTPNAIPVWGNMNTVSDVIHNIAKSNGGSGYSALRQ